MVSREMHGSQTKPLAASLANFSRERELHAVDTMWFDLRYLRVVWNKYDADRVLKFYWVAQLSTL